MSKNRITLSILTVLILAGVGVVLAMNPLSGQKITNYKDMAPEGFPSDFPVDPNIVEVLKSQKIVHPDGSVELIYGYTTTKSQDEAFDDAVMYAIYVNPNEFYTGNGTDEDGNDTRYFMAENAAQTKKIDADFSIIKDSLDANSYVELNIINK